MSLTFRLTPDQLKLAAAIGKAASSDDARPVLCHVSVEWDVVDDEIEVVFAATDSYLLAVRTFYVPVDDEDVAVDDAGQVLISARDLARATPALAKDHKILDRVPITFDEKVTLGSDRLNQTLLATGDYTFPNWRQLIPGEPVTEDYEGPLPALNPAYIKRLLDSSGVAGPRDNTPVQFALGDGANGHLKPVVYSIPRSAGYRNAWPTSWVGLQMPIRV